MKAKKRVITTQPKWLQGYAKHGTQIRFGGLWLKELGFEPGAKCEIIHEDNKLIIQPLGAE